MFRCSSRSSVFLISSSSWRVGTDAADFSSGDVDGKISGANNFDGGAEIHSASVVSFYLVSHSTIGQHQTRIVVKSVHVVEASSPMHNAKMPCEKHFSLLKEELIFRPNPQNSF